MSEPANPISTWESLYRTQVTVLREILTEFPTDARGTIVALTPAGVDVFRRVGAQHGRSITARMAALSPAEQAQLRALTEKLRAGAEHG